MAQDTSTTSEDCAIRNWLEAADNSASTSSHFQIKDIGSVFEEDVPKASSILARRRCCHETHDCEDESADSVTNMHLQDLTQLSACFFDMNVILERVSRDLGHFSSRKDGATQLLLDNPELPGIDVLAALNATHLILQNAICTNISDISGFMEMLSGIMQTMEGDAQPKSAKESAFWTRSSDADAWNIAFPSDDVFKTDARQKPWTRSNKAYNLKYHDDIKDIDSPPLHASRSSSADNPGPQSRRVILDNLPSDITTPQVLQSIRCYGGIISALVTNNLSKASTRKKTAIIEFVYPQSAADVVAHFDKNKISFVDSKGHQYQPRIYLIPTPSYSHSLLNHGLLDSGCTRALLMPNFPQGAIWHLLCAIGTKHINTVQLSEGHLTIELTSLFQSKQAEKQIRCANTAVQYNATKHGMRYVPDSSQGKMQDNRASHRPIMAFTSPDILQTTWDRAPYNTYAPTAKRAVTQPPKPTHEQLLAEYFSIDASQVRSYLQDRKSFQDTTFKIIGSTIQLTRRKWSWSISAEDQLKLLMANTLHDPDWAAEWDAYFRAKGVVNLRTWEEYGMLAKHRRERAAEQGLAEGIVPTCAGCSWGCRDLKSVPVARLIRDYVLCEHVHTEGD